MIACQIEQTKQYETNRMQYDNKQKLHRCETQEKSLERKDVVCLVCFDFLILFRFSFIFLFLKFVRYVFVCDVVYRQMIRSICVVPEESNNYEKKQKSTI